MKTKTSFLGQKFGRLTIVGEEPQPKGSARKVFVRCDCGTEKLVALPSLKNGNTKSCGCYHRERAFGYATGTSRPTKAYTKTPKRDYAGQVFGRLTVIGEDPDYVPHRTQRKVIVKCECGTEKSVFLLALKRGHTTSCGCHLKAVCFGVGMKLVINRTTNQTWPSCTEAATELGLSISAMSRRITRGKPINGELFQYVIKEVTNETTVHQ